MNRIQKIAAYIVLMWLILGEVTILPRLIKDYLGIGSLNVMNICFFVLFLLICSTSLRNLSIPTKGGMNNIIIFVLGGYLIFLIIEMINVIYSGSSVKAIIIMIWNYLIIIFISFAVVFSQSSPDRGFRLLIKPYVHFSLYITTVGVVAYFLVISNMVNLADWLFINNYMKKGFEVERGMFSFPYYMSLFFYGEELYTFLNIPIIRSSGLSHEPNVAGLFTAPFLFMIDYYFGERKIIKRYAYVTTSLYIFAIGSITTYLIIAFIITGYFLKKIIKTPNLSTILIMGLILLGLFQYILFDPLSAGRDLFSKVQSSMLFFFDVHLYPIIHIENFFGSGMMSRLSPTENPRGMIGVVFFYFFILLISLSSYLHFFKKRYFSTFSLLILYIVGHSLKSPKHVYFLLTTTYFIVVFAIWIGFYNYILYDRIFNINNRQAFLFQKKRKAS